MQVKVSDLMTRELARVSEKTSFQEGMEILLKQEASQIYVTDERDYLLGVVPDYELLKANLSRIPADASIETFISRDVATTSPETQITEILPLFRDGCHQQLAVIEQGRLVGQVTRRDVLRLLTTLKALEPETGTVNVDEPVHETVSPPHSPRFIRTQQRSSDFRTNV